MIRRPPRSTRTDTLFPYTTLFRSVRRFFPKAAPLPTRQQTALQWTMRRCGGAFRCGRYQSAASSAYIVQFVIPHDGSVRKSLPLQDGVNSLFCHELVIGGFIHKAVQFGRVSKAQAKKPAVLLRIDIGRAHV